MVGGGRAWLWGGMHGCGGVCVIEGGMRRIRRDMVNERVVRILLECILVLLMFFFSHDFFLFSAFVRLEWVSNES